MAEHLDENELISSRRAKLEAITKSGVSPYGERFNISSSIKKFLPTNNKSVGTSVIKIF